MTAGIRWLATVFAAALTTGMLSPTTAGASQAPTIIGGDVAAITDYPWAVALVDSLGSQFCAGTLTEPNIVVTAAHCLSGRGAGSILVLGGRSDLAQVTPGEELSTVDSVAVEPDYIDPHLGADLATLTLHTAFPYRPLAVADDAPDLYAPGTMATVLGWGRESPTGPDNTVLHDVQVPIVDDQTCARVFDRFVSGAEYDPDAMFCAGYVTAQGDQGHDACRGDAGGPLVIDDKLAGIVSWGVGCGQYPSYYTKVPNYLGMHRGAPRHVRRRTTAVPD